MLRTVGDPHTLPRTLETAALRLDGSAVVRHSRTMQDTLEAEIFPNPVLA